LPAWRAWIRRKLVNRLRAENESLARMQVRIRAQSFHWQGCSIYMIGAHQNTLVGPVLLLDCDLW
jgi:hypothetical protein